MFKLEVDKELLWKNKIKKLNFIQAKFNEEKYGKFSTITAVSNNMIVFWNYKDIAKNNTKSSNIKIFDQNI